MKKKLTFAKAVNAFNKAKEANSKTMQKQMLSKDPKVAALEQRAFDIADRAKKEGINA